MFTDRAVSIAGANGKAQYPEAPPFLPSVSYPELAGRVASSSGPHNVVYDLLRENMLLLGMDVERFDTPEWNPLGEIVKPGDNVLIKPNLVRHIHLGGGDYEAVVTHPSVVRAILDYAAIALKGSGEITVGDAPLQSADFAKIVERTSLDAVCKDVEKAYKINVRLVDFRLWRIELDDGHKVVRGDSQKGDPKGYYRVNLGTRSLLKPLAKFSEKFRVTNYDYEEMSLHHNHETNEYLIPRTVLDADVVINVPKLKTHHKVGLTAALKNLVGINGYKDWLPHHRSDSVSEGGDEYRDPSTLKRFRTQIGDEMDKSPYSKLNGVRHLVVRGANKLIKHFASDPYREGSWYGNDTLWRTVLDLNRLLVYADREGVVAELPQRKCITFVDAILAGEGEGPMKPDPRECGLIVGGRNPSAVDAVLATIIGFDYERLPLVANAFHIDDLPLVDFSSGEIEVLSEDEPWRSLRVGASCDEFRFVPPSGWAGHVEARTTSELKS